MNEKAKTTDNGSFFKLFKTLTARVLSSLKSLYLNLIKHCCSCFKHYINDIVARSDITQNYESRFIKADKNVN